jgi:hypothetical protein
MPTLEKHGIYRDAGFAGEDITRRIVTDLPQYLRPGGRFYCHAMFLDRRGEPIEQRVRSWLGDRRMEFDIVLVIREDMDPVLFACQQSLKSGGGMDALREWKALFARLKVTRMFIASLLLRRFEGRRTPATGRRMRGQKTGPAEVEWLLGIESDRAAGAMPVGFLEACPRMSPELSLKVVNRVGERGLQPAEFTLSAPHPFEHSEVTEPWAAMVVAQCDGATTVRKLHEAAPHLSLDAFARRIAALVAAGFLRLR